MFKKIKPNPFLIIEKATSMFQNLHKIKPNPFLIIEKAISMFQNLHELMYDAYPNNEGCNVPRKIERWIR